MVLASNGDPTAAENFKQMKETWRDQIDELTGLVDMATNATEFIKESGKFRLTNPVRVLGPSSF